MRRVSAKFVPRLLTDDQKQNRAEISQELLASKGKGKVVPLQARCGPEGG